MGAQRPLPDWKQGGGVGTRIVYIYKYIISTINYYRIYILQCPKQAAIDRHGGFWWYGGQCWYQLGHLRFPWLNLEIIRSVCVKTDHSYSTWCSLMAWEIVGNKIMVKVQFMVIKNLGSPKLHFYQDYQVSLCQGESKCWSMIGWYQGPISI